MVEIINKLKNPLVKEARELSKSKNRVKYNKIQLRGLEQIRWAKKAGLNIESIFIDKNEEPDKYEEFSSMIYQTSSGILKKITETKYLVPCVGIAKVNSYKDDIDQFVLLLDNVKDHGNIGTIIRTGMAYGINDFIATNSDFDPYITKTIDASRGTTFKSNFKRCNSSKEAVSYLKEKGYQIIATSPHGKSLQSTVNLDKKPVALVVGNETSGVCDEILGAADHIVQIPMHTGVESLNVGVATGISIYELRLKEALTMLAEKIISTIGREVNVTSQLIRKAFDIKVKEVSEFTGDQVIFLMVLKRELKMEGNQIEEQFGYFKDKFEEFIDPLYSNKLIYKTDKKFEITKAGEELLAKLWPIHEKTEDLMLQGFTQEEKKQLKEYLERVQNNCVGIIKK
ncbi:TrmH family RNA methyltransferase [Dethiothermospora halolimnae]|uniref:TrmH family RNA methyltransferase n=1 Tax=Dethiothermospora halolimnae TaxID=3114390 RepID=UPI003CCBD047